MDYAGFQQAITIIAQQAPSPYTALPPGFSNMIPNFIDYAEGRILRDNVFLATRTANTSLTTASGNRTIDFSAMSTVIIVPEGLSLIMPASTAPAAGTRYAYDLASLDTIDLIWPQESVTASPSDAEQYGRYCAMKSATLMVIAPTPDAAYTCEVTGLFRPAPLSETNPTTYISLNYGELMLAAAMISVCGYLRDYGQQADDPKLAQSWENQYQILKDGVLVEEQRRRTQGVGWSQNTPTPLATPART